MGKNWGKKCHKNVSIKKNMDFPCVYGFFVVPLHPNCQKRTFVYYTLVYHSKKDGHFYKFNI